MSIPEDGSVYLIRNVRTGTCIDLDGGLFDCPMPLEIILNLYSRQRGRWHKSSRL